MKDVENSGLHHLFLGHYHQPVEGILYTYPGSPHPLSSSERGCRGAVVAEVSARGTVHREWKAVANFPFHDFDLDVTGCMTRHEVRERLRGAVANLQGLARVTLSGELHSNLEFSLKELAEAGYSIDLSLRKGKLLPTLDLSTLAKEPTVRGQFVRDVLEETVPTVFESGNDLWKFLPASNEFIWFSERDNWGHLYLYDLQTGKLKNKITDGEGNVDQIDRIDEKTRTIYYTGLGREKDRDPYFRHFYRIGFDGRNQALLTPEVADHNVSLSPNGRFLVDSYSTPDKEPVANLRDAQGRLVTELERADLKALLAKGWKPPIPFTVKARDGVTDLYGLMFRPTNFDPTRKYPVVDYIYPGPQTGSVGSRRSISAGNGSNFFFHPGGSVVDRVITDDGRSRTEWIAAHQRAALLHGFGQHLIAAIDDRAALDQQPPPRRRLFSSRLAAFTLAMLSVGSAIYLFSLFNTMLGLKVVSWSRAAAEDVFRLLLSCALVTLTVALLEFLFVPGQYLPLRFTYTAGAVVLVSFVAVRYRLRLVTGLASRWITWPRSGSISEMASTVSRVV